MTQVLASFQLPRQYNNDTSPCIISASIPNTLILTSFAVLKPNSSQSSSCAEWFWASWMLSSFRLHSCFAQLASSCAFIICSHNLNDSGVWFCLMPSTNEAWSNIMSHATAGVHHSMIWPLQGMHPPQTAAFCWASKPATEQARFSLVVRGLKGFFHIHNYSPPASLILDAWELIGLHLLHPCTGFPQLSCCTQKCNNCMR